MSEWRGLHNPKRHRSTPDPDRWGDDFQLRCVECNRWCYESAPCRCCLAAEVERLTGLLEAADNVVAAQDRRIAEALAYCDELKPIAFGWKIERILRGESDA